MTVSGLEMLTIEIRLAEDAYSSGTKLRTTEVMLSMVSPRKLCARMAVEDALVVLAISRITPGAVSCRFTLVMSTSSGGLRVAVTASATLTENLRMAAVTASSPTKSWCEFLSRMNAGEIVTSIETVALYPISVTPRMAPRRRGRKRIVARFLGSFTMQQTVLFVQQPS